MVVADTIYSKARQQIKSYWLEFLEQSSQVGSLLDSSAEYSLNRAYTDLYNLKSSSIVQADWAIKIPWFPILVSIDETKLYVYNDPDSQSYDDPNQIFYGSQKPNLYAELPKEFLTADLVTDSILSPDITLTRGIDFQIEENEDVKLIRLSTRILESKFISVVGDRRVLVLWIKFPTFINEYYFSTSFIFTGEDVSRGRFGLALTKNLYKARAQGLSLSTLYGIVEGITKTDIIKQRQEVVLRNTEVLITDKNRYDISTKVTPFVEGDILEEGTSLTGGVRIYYGEDIVNCGDLRITKVPGSNAIFDITVNNTAGVAQLVGTDNEGRSILALPSSGTNVNKFWELLHKNAVSGGKSLAEALFDTSVVSQSTLNTKPINTLHLLSETILYNDILIELDSNLVDINYFNKFRGLLERIKNPASNILIKVV